jgi:hypothetical protein
LLDLQVSCAWRWAYLQLKYNRIRRVKCDEARPQCLRCLKFGAECDGYPFPSEHQPAKKTRVTFKIRPWSGPGLKSESLAQKSRLLPVQIQQLRPDISFQNETEQRYFRAFRYDVIPQISGVFHSSFWNHIILPTCHDEDAPFIRDGVLALAAVSLSTRESHHPKNSSRHYQFGLERYGRAVRAMRSMLSNEERHLRKALIGCLLVFCFEVLLGYPKQALLHATSGYHLLQNCMVKNSHPLIRPKNIPHASSLIEDELFDTFNMLHLHAVSAIGDACAPESNEIEQVNSNEVMTNMPPAFSDLNEAQRYLIVIFKRVATFVQKATKVATSSSPNDMHQPYLGGQIEHSSSSIEFGLPDDSLFSSDPIPQNILKEYYRYAQEIVRWQESFKPVRLNPDRPNQSGVIHLQSNATAMRLHLESVVAKDECSFDKFLPQCRSIITLAKTLFPTTPKPSSLACAISMDVLGIIPALFKVCNVCRDGLVRREAIAMLKMCPRREGVYDNMLAAQTSTWLMDIEEEGLIDGYIPENARARITKMEVDFLTKSANVECLKRTNDVQGGVVIRKTTIRWD